MNNIKSFCHKDYLNNNILYIRWVVTYNCDLKCPYCYLYHEENYSTKEEYTKIVDFINSMINDYDIVRLTLFGGECTQHPNFIDILNRLDNNIYIRLDTNLNYDINYLKQIVNTNKINEYQPSYHYNIVDEDLFYNNYLYLVNNMNNNYTINTILMMEKKYVNDIFELQKNKYKNSMIKRVKDNINNIWSEEDYNVFERIAKLDNNNLNYYNKNYYIKDINNNEIYLSEAELDLYMFRNFKYFLCETPKHLMFITSNGNIYPCQQHSELNPTPEPLANIINDKNIKETLKNKKQICKCYYCCEIDIPKHKVINRTLFKGFN